jgi:hypothetical protein
MYCCNLICNGEIESGKNLKVRTLSSAIVAGHYLFNNISADISGFEIWHDNVLAYTFGEMAFE